MTLFIFYNVQNHISTPAKSPSALCITMTWDWAVVMMYESIRSLFPLHKHAITASNDPCLCYGFEDKLKFLDPFPMHFAGGGQGESLEEM